MLNKRAATEIYRIDTSDLAPGHLGAAMRNA